MPSRRKPPAAPLQAPDDAGDPVDEILVINGWTFLVWPAFDERWRGLLVAVARRRMTDPPGYARSPEARMLKALIEIIRDRIARDPNAADARLKGDLGAWRRIRFFGRFRLFYRFDSATRTVILTWLTDAETLRKEGARTDPYLVFAKMLARGEVPSGWAELEAGSARMAGAPDAGPG